MCKEKNFSEDRIRSSSKRLAKARGGQTQMRMDSFFKVSRGKPVRLLAICCIDFDDAYLTQPALLFLNHRRFQVRQASANRKTGTTITGRRRNWAQPRGKRRRPREDSKGPNKRLSMKSMSLLRLIYFISTWCIRMFVSILLLFVSDGINSVADYDSTPCGVVRRCRWRDSSN